jgi:hypothetical protein
VAHRVELSMWTYFFSVSPNFLMPERISIALEEKKKGVRNCTEKDRNCWEIQVPGPALVICAIGA